MARNRQINELYAFVEPASLGLLLLSDDKMADAVDVMAFLGRKFSDFVKFYAV